MTEKVTGTVEETSTPSESKFDKATEAMRGSLFQGEVTTEDDLLDKGSTRQNDSEEKDGKLVEKQEEKSEEEGTDNWEKRYKHVQSYADKMSSKAEQIASTLISKDPNAIHDIAKTDPELADKLVAKELSEQYGINTYEELLAAAKLETSTSQDGDPRVKELEERLKTLEAEKEANEQSKAEEFIGTFKSNNPDFKGDIEKKTWELFDNSNLSLDQAYKFVMFDSGKTVKESEIEEKVYQKMANERAASSIASPSAKTIGKTPKAMSSKDRNFLEGIGATKTLKKNY